MRRCVDVLISCNDEDVAGVDADGVVRLKDNKAWKVMKHNRSGGVSESDAKCTNPLLELATIIQSDYRDSAVFTLSASRTSCLARFAHFSSRVMSLHTTSILSFLSSLQSLPLRIHRKTGATL